MSKDYDLEAKAADPAYVQETDSGEYIGDEGAIRGEALIIGDSLYARVQRFANRFGVEARGIERVPSDERTTDGMSQIGTMVGVSAIAVLYHVYGLWRIGADKTRSGFPPTWSFPPLPSVRSHTPSSTSDS
jgi:hypothetical protein